MSGRGGGEFEEAAEGVGQAHLLRGAAIRREQGRAGDDHRVDHDRRLHRLYGFHALKRAINFHQRGELRDRTGEGQHYRVAGLNLLAAISPPPANDPAMAANSRRPAQAAARPRNSPPAAVARPSDQCGPDQPGQAPSRGAMRMATSRLRTTERPKRSVAAFAHATTNTSSAAAIDTRRTGRSSTRNASSTGVPRAGPNPAGMTAATS